MSAPRLSDGALDLLDERRQEALDALLDLREAEGPWVWPPVDGGSSEAVAGREGLGAWLLGTFEDEDGYTCPVVLEVQS